MTTLAVTLKRLRRANGAGPLDLARVTSDYDRLYRQLPISDNEPVRQAELVAYLEAMGAARHKPRIKNVDLAEPSLYQEVWWKLTSEQLDGFPYATFPVVTDLGANACGKAVSAIRTLLRRHRILRSIFKAEDGRLAIQFCGEDDVPISVTSVPDEKALILLLNAKRDLPVPITMEPPVRIHLISCGSRTVASFAFHHAIIDHVSARIIQRELASLLGQERIVAEESGERPDFYDWAAGERAWFNSSYGETVCGYWRNWRRRIPDLCLASGTKLNWAKGTRTKHKIDMNPTFVDAIGQRARQLGTTPFVIVLCAYAMALRRWTGKSHFPIRAVGNARSPSFFTAGLGLFMCHDPIEVDFRDISNMQDAIADLSTEYRSSVSLRIPTHMTGSGADYDVLHSTIAASINFVPDIARFADAAPSQAPNIILSEPNEPPIIWCVPQPTIVLELIGRRGALSGCIAFNDSLVSDSDQRQISELFRQMMWDVLQDRVKV